MLILTESVIHTDTESDHVTETDTGVTKSLARTLSDTDTDFDTNAYSGTDTDSDMS